MTADKGLITIMKNINIKAVTNLIGINENTLRAWERRNKILSPSRDEEGRRIYDKKDIEKISLLWRLVQNGHLIGNLAEKSLSELRTMSEELPKLTNQTLESSTKKIIKPEDKYLNQIIKAVQKYDLADIHLSLQNARFDLSPRVLIMDLVLPLLSEVGKLVAEEKLKVAQEHLLSSMLRDYLGMLYQSLSPYEYHKKTNSKRVLLTTREGDLHEFGILIAAILCRINGHESYYLGPNAPVEDLAEACSHFKIQYLILSFSAIPKEKEIISSARYLKRLEDLLPKKLQILCGGSDLFENKELLKKANVVQLSSLHELDSYLSK